uniref:FTH domain-containing protein n=1 Tax=Panagrellus redivivus TaxID=6233 RepID=A0A7E5A282_PANRE
MPYPILTLPFPFARRLCQLLTPEELQNVQIAAGHEIEKLKPIVKSIENKDTLFHFADSKIECVDFNEHSEVLSYLTEDSTLVKCKTAMFQTLTGSTFKNIDLTKIHLKTEELTFTMCNISIDILKSIASRIPAKHEVREFLLFQTRTDENINFPLVFGLFPNLKKIRFNQAYEGWLDDLSNINVVQLEYLCVQHTKLNELFHFKPEELLGFIKKQSPEFRLNIVFACPPGANLLQVSKVIMVFLKPHFDILNGKYKIDVHNGSSQVWLTFYNTY